jgi:hypothetical protein
MRLSLVLIGRQPGELLLTIASTIILGFGTDDHIFWSE